MTFEDLAREYSDCGMDVLAVLGKRGMGLNTVVAGWMRASWLKYVGLVTESVGRLLLFLVMFCV
jgi:membrane protein YqaA with SNARE-associated domain